MEPSLAGSLVLCGILWFGYCLGSPLVIGSFASLAFGSTAIVTLSALGGSSPLVSTAIFAMLILATMLRAGFLQALGRVFARHPIAWLIVALSVYAVVGAIALPRTFAGLTTAFVSSRIEGRVAEIPLVPVSGNITQAAYFLISVSSFFVFGVLLQERRTVNSLRAAMFAFVFFHAGFGLVDLSAKLAGAGDVLLPIRTASYSLLTNIEEAGFARIVGAQAEASSFGSLSLGCLAFTFVYWRQTGAKFALALSVALLGLLLLSTSSTAYAGLTIVVAYLATRAGTSVFYKRIRLQDLGLAGAGIVTSVALLAVLLISERAFDPAIALIDKTVINKAASASAAERFYWNARSLKAFLDTGGLGIGIGSSRASSWIIAVISQLGAIGTFILAVLVLVLFRGLRGVRRTVVGEDLYVLAASLRASSLVFLVGASVGSGSADPGIIFFVAISVVVHTRALALKPAPHRDAVQHPTGSVHVSQSSVT